MDLGVVDVFLKVFDRVKDLFDFTPLTGIRCRYGVHLVEVETDAKESRLFIDNKIVDSRPNVALISPSVAFLRGSIEESDKSSWVNVFFKNEFFKVRIKICVNDVHIGGDAF